MRRVLFLSHAGIDSDAALTLAERIERTPEARTHDLKVWIDKRDLEPGKPWQDQLADAIENQSTAFAVYLGRNGVVNWVESEVRLALSRATGRTDYPFVPIISADSAGPEALPGFARQYQGVHDVEANGGELAKLLRAVLQLDSEQGVRLVPHPYKGLMAFETRDTHLFFGRDDEADELLTRIDRQPLVMVIGDSGSGKSSLVKAGLIARYLGGGLDARAAERRYDRLYIAVQTRPLTNPFGALADDLEDTAKSLQLPIAAIGEIKRLVREQTAQSVYDALRLATPDETEILLFVDQFEELFTSSQPDERKAYIDMLLGLSAGQGKTKVRLVCALRRDYYNLCSQYDAFFAITEQSLYPVRRMSDSQLEACIRRPLALTELKDDPNFAHAVVADVGDQPGDLALMQLAITRAWDQRKHYSSLTETYTAVGRVTGALAQLAEELFNKTLNSEEQRLLEPLLIRLVRLGDTAGVTRRIVWRDELSAPAWALAQKLASEQGNRLLKTSGDANRPTVELSHEALVTQWPLYQGWLQQAAADKRRHDDLMPRARRWQDAEEPNRFLLTGNDLDQALRLRVDRKGWLSDVESAYIEVSEAALAQRQRLERRNSRIIAGLAIASLLAAITAGSLLWRQTGLTERAISARAEAERQAQRADRARAEVEQYVRFLTLDLRDLDDIYATEGSLARALLAFQQALEIRKRLAAADPDKVQWQRDLMEILRKLAEIYAAQGKFDQAMRALQQGLEIAQGFAVEDPDNVVQRQLDLVDFYRKRAAHEVTTPVDARSFLENALTILEELQSKGELHGEQLDWPEAVAARLREIATQD